MPKRSKAEEMVRQWQMVQMLPSSGTGLSADELQKQLALIGYKVDVHTVQTNLRALKEPLGLVVNADSKPYGWTWPGNARLTVPEALSLLLVKQAVGDQIPPSYLVSLASRFKEARRKIDSLGGHNKAARWLDKIASVPRYLRFVPPKLNPKVVETVQAALLDEQQLRIMYKSLADTAPAARIVNPRALLQKGPVTYLIAHKLDDPEPRQYALHRIQSASTTGNPVRRSPFNLRQYLASQGDEIHKGETIDLKLWVSTNLAKILAEARLSEQQVLKPIKDGAELRAPVLDTQPLRQWILSQGPAVEVLEPAYLRAAIFEALRSAAKRY